MHHSFSRPRRASARSRQGGATLLIALLVLVLIMMLGVTAVSTSNTQFKLAGNIQFEDGALNNAESAVTAAETWLATAGNTGATGFVTFDATATPHLLPVGYLAGLLPSQDRPDRPFTINWSDTNPGATVLSVAGTLQRYYIEQLSLNSRLQGSSQVTGGRANAACNQVNTYLVTGRGQGARGAVKFVQTNYSVLNCPS